MKKTHGPIHQYVFYILLVIEVLCIVFVAFQSYIDFNMMNETVFSMNDSWLFYEDNGNIHSITLPAITDAGEDNKVILSNKIPDTTEQFTSIGILTTHQSIIVSIDDEVIYSRMVNPRPSSFFNVPLGSVWDIIPLKSDSQGKTVILELSSEYPNYAGRISEVHLGTKTSILLHTIDNYGIGFILSLTICIMGTFLITFIYL